MTTERSRNRKIVWPLAFNFGGWITAEELTANARERWPEATAITTTIDNQTRGFVTYATLPNEAR